MPAHDPPPRRATLVLVTPAGELLGRLDEIEVATPWWQDARAVVAAARAATGLDLTVLRLLDTELARPQGGGVTYLAEVSGPLPAGVPLRAPLDEALRVRALADAPERPAYARPGGPAADLRWAVEVLGTHGLRLAGAPVQDRTWNLSSLWELPTDDGGSAWLKVVPAFFAHEGAVLARLQGGPVPTLLGRDGPRVLLAAVPGEDQYEAPRAVLLEAVDLLVGVQRAWLGRAAELEAAGVPSARAEPLTAAVADVVARRAAALPPADRAALDRLVAGLGERWAAVTACGLPDTLVHGDAHPGNVRGTPGALTLLDWGDSATGHPMLDREAFLAAVPPADAPAVRAHWSDAWRRAVPGCDPEGAARLLAPVAAARLAVVYQRFVDRVEPTERRFHDADVVDALAAAARALAVEEAAAR
ncbi:phosphotransferase [Actinotalea solisilvae]|uniref:phosphotransferase n=1 Tax=Actinotalea solisilvae TaxID=2072922 RepID=UPI0018F26A98|nr:phosphotransferase [Actinotalea solisilvae]